MTWVAHMDYSNMASTEIAGTISCRRWIAVITKRESIVKLLDPRRAPPLLECWSWAEFRFPRPALRARPAAPLSLLFEFHLSARDPCVRSLAAGKPFFHVL